MLTSLTVTWNDFVLWSQKTFGFLNKDVVTGLLIALSVLTALLLVFLAWDFAEDIRSGKKEKQEQTQPQENHEQEVGENVAMQSQILSVYTQTETVSEELCSVQQIPPIIESVVVEEEVQTQQSASAVEVLREGISQILPNEDETGEMGIRYDRSFTAKLIQSDDKVKEWYSEIKNYLLSYRRVHARMSWSRESFRIGKNCFARLTIKGKTLCIYLAIIPKSCQDTKYKTEESEFLNQKDTPCLYRIKSNRRVAYTKELIDIILQEYDAMLIQNKEAVDYYMPYEGIVDLIKKGLIKRKIVSKQKDFLVDLSSSRNDDNSVA